MQRKNKQEQEIREALFEENMLINNTEMYRFYKEQKEEDEKNGVTGVEWLTPGSIEELHELERMLAEMDGDNQGVEDENLTGQTFISPLSGIDIDKIGDE